MTSYNTGVFGWFQTSGRSPDLSGIDQLHSFGIDTKRLGSVWYDSDIFWLVRTICARPSRRPFELELTGGDGVWHFGARLAIPGGGRTGAFGAQLAIPGGGRVIPNARSWLAGLVVTWLHFGIKRAEFGGFVFTFGLKSLEGINCMKTIPTSTWLFWSMTHGYSTTLNTSNLTQHNKYDLAFL
jgi:hypothetical protein